MYIFLYLTNISLEIIDNSICELISVIAFKLQLENQIYIS